MASGLRITVLALCCAAGHAFTVRALLPVPPLARSQAVTAPRPALCPCCSCESASAVQCKHELSDSAGRDAAFDPLAVDQHELTLFYLAVAQ